MPVRTPDPPLPRARIFRLGYNPRMSSNSDSHADPSGHIEVIARGVAILGRGNDARVLMCQNKKRGYYYLPGGHVDFGESAATALQREILEEMGIDSRVGPPLLIHECAFHDGKVDRHEINALLRVEHLGRPGLPWPDPPPCVESHIAFAWLPLAGLARHDIRPDRARAWLTSHAATLAAGATPPFEWARDFPA